MSNETKQVSGAREWLLRKFKHSHLDSGNIDTNITDLAETCESYASHALSELSTVAARGAAEEIAEKLYPYKSDAAESNKQGFEAIISKHIERNKP